MVRLVIWDAIMPLMTSNDKGKNNKLVPMKANYGGRCQGKICCLCQEEEATQKHVLGESRITEEKTKHFEYTKYFPEDEEKPLKTMVENNITVVELMEEVQPLITMQSFSELSEQPGNRGKRKNTHTHKVKFEI